MLRDTLLAQSSGPSRDAIAVADDAGTLTFAQLLHRSRAIAARVAMLPELAPVGLLLPTGTKYVAGFHGILLSGRPIVPINYMLGAEEVAHIVRDSEMAAVLTTPAMTAKIGGSNVPIIDIDGIDYAVATTGDRDAPRRRPDEVAVLLYTSGTSGTPKGVRLTHGNFTSNVQAMINQTGFVAGDRFVSMVPLFHAFGLTASVLVPIALGARVFYVGRFTPSAVFSAIAREKATVTFAVPAMYAALVRAGANTPPDLSSVRHPVSGGEPLPARVGDEFRRRFGLRLFEGYGLTETSPVISLNTPARHRIGSVGQVVTELELRIVDDAGNSLPCNQDGEIQVRGPSVTSGYHRLPAETAAAFTSDGFFQTGDLGHVDSDRFLFITGRKKDLIIVAGEKVAPRTIEEVLLRHPKVKEAAVVGRSDPMRGEVVAAFIVLDAGVSVTPLEIRDFCHQRGLAPFQIPREVVVLTSLPRTATGKLLRKDLKAMQIKPG